MRLRGGAYADAVFPWDASILDDLAAVDRATPDPAARQRLGERLRAFLDDAGLETREEGLLAAAKEGRQLLVTLRSAAAELYALPWELVTLRATGEHVGDLPGFLLRYEWPGTETAAPHVDPPPEGGRVVFAWSAAGGAVPAAEHLIALRRAAAEAGHEFREDRDVIAQVSPARLRRALSESPVAVLHVLCHGSRLPSDTVGYGLAWDGDDGEPAAIDADALRSLLAPHVGSLRLVVLSACHGADAGAPGSALGSVAQALHRVGVPAVIASRRPLSVEGSIALASTLYRRLLVNQEPVETAFLAGRAALDASDALQLYARAADGPEHRPLVTRPYRGLLTFREEHARYFFGRDAEVNEATSDLARLVEAGAPRFLLVTGASGTGKSSLVSAGVVPAIFAQAAGAARAFTIRPRDGLDRIDAALAARDGRELVLVVDQFEEIFTDLASQAAREAFVRRLWSLASDPASGVSVLASLRVDFLARTGEIALGDGDRYLESVAYNERHRVFVGRTNKAGLRAVIEQPAARAGVELAAGLCDQMLADAGDEPGALPLIEYTLDQLWLLRERRGERYRLTQSAYNELGGVAGALTKKADAILVGLAEIERRAAKRLLVQLVEAREDAAALDTRRRVRMDALRRGPDAEAAAFSRVLDLLVHERLIVLSDEGSEAGGEARPPIVEIAHEQLVRSWATLRRWLREDRQRLLEMRPLATWVEASKGSPTYVLRGDQLSRARELLAKYEHELDPEEKALIARSAARDAWRRRRSLLLTMAAWIGAAMLSVLAVVAWIARIAATRAATEARSESRMAGARELFARHQPTVASLLLLEIPDPEATHGWVTLAHEVLDAGIAKISLRGHGDSVLMAAWSPDGRRVATASYDNTARVWDLDRPGSFVELRGHSKAVYSIAFSPDGERVVTASDDKTARIWELDGARLIQELRHRAGLSRAAFSPDGTRVVTACDDKTAVIWELGGSSEPTRLVGHTSIVTSAVFSPDGGRVVTASLDRTARVWELDSSNHFQSLEGHTGPVMSAAFSPDGKRVVTASRDHTARIWELDSSNPPQSLEGHTEAVMSASFSPDGKRVVTAAEDRTARVWDLESPSEPRVLEGHLAFVNSAAFSPDGERVLTGSNDNTAQVWELAAPGHAMTLPHLATSVVIAAAWSPDGARVITFNDNNTAREVALDGSSNRTDLGRSGRIFAAAFSPDRRRVVTGDDDGAVRLWTLDGKSEALTLGRHGITVHAAAFSPDGRRVVTGAGDKTARVWELDGSGRFLELVGHSGSIYSAAFSPDGRRVVTASDDNTARIWELDKPDSFIELKGHTRWVRYAAFSPDGRRVATSSWDHTARIWDLDRPGAFIELPGHVGRVTAAVWSPDGSRIVTTSYDKTARVWDLNRPGTFFELKGPNAWFTGAAWSPDGQRILTFDWDGGARLWQLSTPELQRILKAASATCLLPELRRTYLAESIDDSTRGFASCERSYGRAVAAP